MSGPSGWPICSVLMDSSLPSKSQSTPSHDLLFRSAYSPRGVLIDGKPLLHTEASMLAHASNFALRNIHVLYIPAGLVTGAVRVQSHKTYWARKTPLRPTENVQITVLELKLQPTKSQELFLVEPITKNRSSVRPKLPGSDSRINCAFSFCGKRSRSSPGTYSYDEGADTLNKRLLSLFWRVLVYKDFRDSAACVLGGLETREEDRLDLQYYEQVDEAEVTGKDIMNVVGFQVLYSQIIQVSRIFERHLDIALNFRPKSQLVKTAYMNLLNLIEKLDKPPQSFSETELSNTRAELVKTNRDRVQARLVEGKA
ncbi:hypothetical protein Bca4012_018209 [Brassica carinata]